MATSNTRTFREKLEKSPSPQRFEEPEGMTTIDLNEGRSFNFHDSLKVDLSKKKYGCWKYFLVLALINLVVVLTFVAALFIQSEFHVLNFYNSSAQLRKVEAFSSSTETIVQSIKDHEESKQFIVDNFEDFALCKITKTLDDCCKFIHGKARVDIAALCTVNDVLDILLDFEQNSDLSRAKRQANVMPYFDPKVLPEIPQRIKAELPNLYRSFHKIIQPPEQEINQPRITEEFEYEDFRDDENHVDLDYKNREHFHEERPVLPVAYFEHPAESNYQVPQENFLYDLPGGHAQLRMDLGVNPRARIDSPYNQQLPLAPSHYQPASSNYKHDTTTDKIEINDKKMQISFFEEPQKPGQSLNNQPKTIETKKVKVNAGKKIAKPDLENHDLTADSSEVSEKKTLVKPRLKVESKPKTAKGNLKHDPTTIKVDSSIERVSNITGENNTVELDLDNMSVHLKPSKIFTEQSKTTHEEASTTVSASSSQDSLPSSTELSLPETTTEEIIPSLVLLRNNDEQESKNRLNQMDYRQKLTTSEDIQSSQQSVVSPCFYNLGSPYKLAPTMDGSQFMKIISLPNSNKVQQPLYVLNPPMYSYVPPQAPYIQSYAPPLQQPFSTYNNPVQVAGPGGQYYMCSPIPAPSNNIASIPGVEVRSNLQEMLSDSEPPSNKSREATTIVCPLGEQGCTDGSRCIRLHQVCDNEINCDDGSDELFCSCRERVGKLRQCDGYFDCPNGEDEQGCFGCNDNEFSCDDWSRVRRSTCIPLEQRCDNIRQCEITGKDEEDCSVLADQIGKQPEFKISNTVGYLHRNYKGRWYPTCFGTDVWAMDVCKIEAGPSHIMPKTHMMLTTNSYNGEYINILPNNEVSLVNTCIQDRAAFVECPPLYCGLRMMVKNPYRQQEVDNSVENALTNLERFPDSFTTRQANNSDSEFVSSSRVVGGKASQPAAWPWLVSVYKNGMFHCGGVLINELWVITAAHCVDRYWQYYYEVQAGILRRFSFSPMEQTRWIVQAIAHEDYHKADLKNDIALMRLSAPVRYNRYVRPICLPSETTAGRDFLRGPPPGTICTTVGWGATIEHGTDPDNMREVEVPILPSCKHQEDQDGEEICAGLSEGGKDACQGDSGGPFMCRNPNNPSQWYLAGVVSHGEGCARPNEPGVYTRVSKFVGWISENIREDKFSVRVPLQKCPGYTCKGTNRCLPKKRHCDKIVDCLFGDDETSCNNVNNIFKHTRFSDLLGSPQEPVKHPGLVTTLLDGLFPEKSQNNGSITTISPPEDAEKESKFTAISTKPPNNHSETTTIKHHDVQPDGEPTHKNDMKQYFKCTKMLQIVPINKKCNKIVDCEDGTDEMDCMCVDYIRNANRMAICDGITDCADLSDESDCGKCNATSFYCRHSRQCIDLARRCDGSVDCDGNEDELDCAALTNGETLTLDSDLRPKLGMSGIITINRLGVWRPLCTNVSDNDASLATNVCNLLGFEEYTFYRQYAVQDKPLQVTMDRFGQHFYNASPVVMSNISTCQGLVVRCSNVSMDASVRHIYRDKNVELYTSPWNAVIYSEGIYRCMGTVLDTRWIVTSINCLKGLTMLQLHYVVVLLGKGKSQLTVEGPHEQTIRVVETIRINTTDVLLLRLEKEIVYNRYVKPAHLNIRRDEAIKEKCVAIGIEENRSQYITLTPIKNCLVGRRCFESKIKDNCKDVQAWSGAVVCDSRSGWYPAAVFHEPTGRCGLSKTKEYTSIQYYKRTILEAMGKSEVRVEPPHCNGFRCNLGECLNEQLACDGIPHCRSGEDENPDLCYNKEMKCHLTDNCVCPHTHLKCNNNKCVPKSSFCDRNNDCGDFEDEPPVCSCAAYLMLTNSSKICDKVVNCLDRTDEDPKICSCGLQDFKCGQSDHCVSNEMVCDGFADCPNGEDEATCLSLEVFDKKWPHTGEVLTRTAGKWHAGCFQKNYTQNELQEICLQLGFGGDGGFVVPPYNGFFARNLTASQPVIDPFDVVWIHRHAGNKLKLRMRSGNEPYVQFQPDDECFRLFIECI